MSLQLTWDDLIIQNISKSNAFKWLGCWSHVISGQVTPLFLSKFGDWFLRLPNGSTNELSVIEGTYSTIAFNPEEFASLVNTPSWQEQHLLSFLVLQLHERGLIPSPSQCFAFSPHPALTGRIELDQVILMDIGVWQTICAQHFLADQGVQLRRSDIASRGKGHAAPLGLKHKKRV